jgi:hypothetical protein
VLRGLGANSTFIVATGTGATGCAEYSAVICIASSDGNYVTGPPANTCTVTAGLTQGSTQITLSNLAGNCPSAISSSTPTLIFIDACDTGFSGIACATGSSTDNSNWFVCSTEFSSPHGCSADGADVQRPNRGQLEVHICTSIVGGVCTLSQPILAPNWGSLSNPQAWIIQPVTNVGVENLSIDGSASGAPQTGVGILNAYHVWVSGVRTTNFYAAGISSLEMAYSIWQNNYVDTCTGSGTTCYGFDWVASGNNFIVNNISRNSLGPFWVDGSDSGNVVAYNYCVNSARETSGDLYACAVNHAVDFLDLYEGNVFNQISAGDDIHGTTDAPTEFRNFLTGWESYPSNPITSYTDARQDFAYSRYSHGIANVMGTPGYNTPYSSTSAGAAVLSIGAAPPGVSSPDALSKSTALFWASYDSVTAANRFCGNSLDTGWSATCGSASESAFSASTYPAFVPTVGDTAAGEAALPVSFIFSTRPGWWSSSIPFPAMGSDVSGGNVIQCGGTLNTVGNYSGVPALATSSKCPSGGTGWAGHVNAIPAMSCYLNVMGGVPDGTGSALTFNPMACYGGYSITSGAASAGNVQIKGTVVVQ